MKKILSWLFLSSFFISIIYFAINSLFGEVLLAIACLYILAYLLAISITEIFK